MQRWHYTRLTFMDGWMRLIRDGDIREDEDPGARSARAAECQQTMLNELGEQGFVVYEVKIDVDAHAEYFLRRPID
jgi:hypothetical protein